MSQRTKLTPAQEMIKEAIIQLWTSGGTPVSIEHIASLTEREGAGPVSDSKVRSTIRKWTEVGVTKAQTPFHGRGETLRAYWGAAPHEATLADAIVHALNVLPKDARSQLRTAMRTLFGLPYQAGESSILNAARTISAADLHTIPERVYQASIRAHASKATASNLRAVTRRALRAAAQDECVPVVLPKVRDHDAWERALHVYLGQDARGISERTASAYRVYWRKLAKVAREVCGDATGPEDLSEKQVEEIRYHLKRRGLPKGAREVIQVLRYVGRTHAFGPYADLRESQPDTRGGGRTPTKGYLLDADGRAALWRWEDLIRTLRDNGLPEEWMEFIAWYARYTSVPSHQIEQDPEIPTDRSPARVLGAGGVKHRIVALRAWCFHALEALQDSWDLDPDDVTLERAFGTGAELIARHVQAWWAERAERGEVASAHSGGLRHICIGVAMVARALYDRSLYQRQASVSLKDGAPVSEIDDEERAKTPKEEGWWRTYRAMSARVQRLEVAQRGSEQGHVYTDLKDIQLIITQTPPSYWSRLQEELLARVHQARQEGTNDPEAYHRLVKLAYMTGALISTGFRIRELCHVRLGEYWCPRRKSWQERQYGPRLRKKRLIKLRAADRKNSRSHAAYLRERYCPAWLEDAWLEETRPRYMANEGQDHDWLMVKRNGRPYGCLEEMDDGSGRDEKPLVQREADLTCWWQAWLMQIAVEVGLDVPTGPYEFSPHVIRNVFGYLLYQTHSKPAAASYLGDRPDTVDDTYASVQGIHVDVSHADPGSLGFIREEIPGEGSESRTSSGSAGGVADEILELTRAWKDGHLSDKLYRSAIKELESRMDS